MYQLHLSENYSSVNHYSGVELRELEAIAHIPVKPSNDYYTLNDVITSGQHLHGEHVNIQAVVKQVGSRICSVLSRSQLCAAQAF